MVLNKEFYDKLVEVIENKKPTDQNLVRYVSKNSNEESYRIIDYLMKNYPDNQKVLKEIRDYYSNIKIDQHRCLVIADTHIGRLNYKEKVEIPNSVLANDVLLLKAYEFAYKNGLKYVIHAGDLIEGDSYLYQKRLPILYQLEYLKQLYPQDSSAYTYFLYGNHDFNVIYNGITSDERTFRIALGKPYSHSDVPDTFRSIKNFESIGLNRAYISFPDSLIKVSHENKIANYLYAPDYTSLCNLLLAGHSHRFSQTPDGTLLVPCTACTSQSQSDTGFVELIEEEKEFVAKRYNGEYVQTGEIVIRKKYIRG